ncbi:MmcQ/YjbR family DNA-binding protein [Luteococcus japonicus]|uniref:MmcQ/YjbR family DNA-binding protein n=1 Tax=Luteococcus japonicus TaxID=33984 RepID=UPI000B9C11C3|nr:MmcQ/YjbR family DNA-binding protein [Luteococcus japonicus]
MHGKRVQERAAECAEELSGAELTHPFGDDWDVYKVSGKVFMLFNQVEGQPVVILKSAPGAAKALVEGMDDFTPGYHMNKELRFPPDRGGLAATRRPGRASRWSARN